MMKTAALFSKLLARPRGRANSARRMPSQRALPRLEPLEDRTLLDAVHILTSEHTDLDVTYSAATGNLRLAENNKSVDPIAYYPADHTILEFLPGSKRSQSSDPRFAFTGAAAGQPIWIVPISPRDPSLLQLGVSGERIDSGILASYNETDSRINNVIPFPWIRLSVVNVQGPGQFSVWQTDDFGSPTVWVATAGNQKPNMFFTGPGGHVDYNWAFTAPGNYTVDIQASAFLADSTPISSDVTTYYFQVDDTAAPPGAAVPDRQSKKNDSAVVATQVQAITGLPATVVGPLSGTSTPLIAPTQMYLMAPAREPVSASAVNNSLSLGVKHLSQSNLTVERTELGNIVASIDL